MEKLSQDIKGETMKNKPIWYVIENNGILVVKSKLKRKAIFMKKLDEFINQSEIDFNTTNSTMKQFDSMLEIVDKYMLREHRIDSKSKSYIDLDNWDEKPLSPFLKKEFNKIKKHKTKKSHLTNE